MGIFLMLFGGIAIAVGIFGKNFYNADVISLAPYKEKSSTWSGRLIFLIAGIGLLAIGVKLLLESN